MDKWLNNSNISKVIALVLALILWAIVHLDDTAAPTQVAALEDIKVIDDVKIQAVGLDSSRYILHKITPEVVRIQVKGKSSALASAMPEDYQVKVDVTGLGEGTHSLDLTTLLPKNIQLVSMVPAHVQVDIEALQTKEMDVTIKTTGTPTQGYTVGQPIITPSGRVHVTLPQSQMKDISRVGATLNIDKVSEAVKQKRLKLTAYDKDGNEMTDAVIAPAVVEVELPITKPYKSVPLQISYIGSLPEGLAISSLKQSANQVALYGPQSALDPIEFYDSVQIDLSKLKASTTLTIPLTSPNKVEKIEPTSVNFEITIVPSTERKLDELPIALNGGNDQMKATIQEPATQKISVTLAGAPDIVNSLTTADVQLIADVSNLPPGLHDVPLIVNVPSFVRIVDADQLRVKVLITDSQVHATGTEEQTGAQPVTGTTTPEADTGTKQETRPLTQDSATQDSTTLDPSQSQGSTDSANTTGTDQAQ